MYKSSLFSLLLISVRTERTYQFSFPRWRLLGNARRSFFLFPCARARPLFDWQAYLLKLVSKEGHFCIAPFARFPRACHIWLFRPQRYISCQFLLYSQITLFRTSSAQLICRARRENLDVAHARLDELNDIQAFLFY